MKRIIPFILFIAVVFTSCEYDNDSPYADFTVNYDLVTPGEVIKFRNYSHDANYYEWDFGDGNISTEMNPYHYYDGEGIYRVTLAAYHNNRVDYTSLEIEVYYTTLEIQVLDWETEEIIPRANVVLYPSRYDYESFGTEYFRGVSDYDGKVVLKDINASDTYYIDVYNDYFNNFTLAMEDIENIHTLPLEYAMHNVFVAWVDPAAGSFKSASGEQLTLRKVEVRAEKRNVEKKQYSIKK